MLSADAIVVLGCRIRPSGRLAPPAARRAATAASAFHRGVAPWIVASGGRRWGSQIEARALRHELVRRGVPAGAVVEELCSMSTYENALFSAALLRRLGVRRAAIVTCPWHLRRAVDDFRATGIDAVPCPTGPVAMPLWRRLYLGAHELVCRRLDARALARGRVLAEAAAATALPVGDP